jgi:hypothetical protein
MSLALLSGERVVSCEINRPLEGAWHAIVEVDAAKVPTGRVTLTVEGGLSLSGTVVRGADVNGRITVRVVGGAGGLSKVIPAKFYQGTTVRTVVRDTLSASGEALAASSDAAVVTRSIASWARPSGLCSAVLSELLRTGGAVWRTLADGTVWVGVPTYPTRTFVYEALDEDPVQRSFVLTTDDPTLDANVTIDGRRITYVRTTIEASAVRTTAFYDP